MEEVLVLEEVVLVEVFPDLAEADLVGVEPHEAFETSVTYIFYESWVLSHNNKFLY